MSTRNQQFVSNLTEVERLQIIADYEIFRKSGVIGDSVIRSKAEEINQCFYGDHAQIVFVMKELANDVFEFYALKYLGQNDNF